MGTFFATIPDNFTLSVEDIRYMRHSQLAELTGIDPSNFVAWSHRRRISERSLERIAQRLNISKADLLKGIELRRQDAAIARAAQTKTDQLIAFLRLNQQQEQEPA
jgi:transcriptional regulator with XRE-family HTH domain